MNPRETLFFIGQCLTINHDLENKEKITYKLKSTEINWDEIVKISTSHYVFPTLYLNLKQANLLSYLPQELVKYMEHITSLNKERNLEIIKQAKELDLILRKHDIKPIFLKGTGLLLQEIYSDLGERMVGDIDFLVNPINFNKAAEILEGLGYKKTNKNENNYPIMEKHYPRLYHEEKIGAVEVHLRMVKGNLTDSFNHDICKSDLLEQNHFRFLSYEDQLCLAILAKQHNDNNKFYKRANLRSFYDVFLLSQKIDFASFSKKYKFFYELLNPYLALSAIVMDTQMIQSKSEKRSESFLKLAIKKIDSPVYGSRHDFIIDQFILVKIKLKNLLLFFTRTDYRKYYIKKVLKL